MKSNEQLRRGCYDDTPLYAEKWKNQYGLGCKGTVTTIFIELSNLPEMKTHIGTIITATSQFKILFEMLILEYPSIYLTAIFVAHSLIKIQPSITFLCCAPN